MSKRYGAKPLFENLTMALHDGQRIGLTGPNGSGKSTLMRIMAATDVPDDGLRTIRKQTIVAYVPQAEEVDWSFPVLVEDVVMMGRYGHMGFFRIPGTADYAAVNNALARVNMTDYRKRQIGELSGGQRKRVFLARALAQDGRVILLDEPFTGVDVQTEDAIIKLLREMRDEGRVMLVSTHNLGSVPEFCDRTVLVKGTVLAYGPTETTFTRENLELAFGGVLRRFVLGGADLHDDDDARSVSVFTDDEKPFVIYDKPAAKQVAK